MCEQVQARPVPVLEHWLLCWLARRLMVIRGGALNVRELVCPSELVRVEPQVISWGRATEGVALRGLAPGWVRASRGARFVLAGAEPVLHGAA